MFDQACESGDGCGRHVDFPRHFFDQIRRCDSAGVCRITDFRNFLFPYVFCDVFPCVSWMFWVGMYLSIVLLAFAHGFFFLPVCLALFGPDSVSDEKMVPLSAGSPLLGGRIADEVSVNQRENYGTRR